MLLKVGAIPYSLCGHQYNDHFSSYLNMKQFLFFRTRMLPGNTQDDFLDNRGERKAPIDASMGRQTPPPVSFCVWVSEFPLTLEKPGSEIRPGGWVSSLACLIGTQVRDGSSVSPQISSATNATCDSISSLTCLVSC